MGIIADFVGTSLIKFQIAIGGVNLKNSTGNLLVRNAADTLDSNITANQLNNSGDSLIINSDAVSSGADWTVTLARAAAGMSANTRFQFPPNNGTASFVLQTDGAGNTTWVANSGATNQVAVDTTSVAFGTVSPLTLFTLPANAIIKYIDVIIDTAFNGAPTISVGVTGTTSKYLSSNQVDLLDVAVSKAYRVHPNVIANASSENLIATYAAGGATVGAARIQVNYVIPS
jgi:hypothetical protein